VRNLILAIAGLILAIASSAALADLAREAEGEVRRPAATIDVPPILLR
jgi:hypothetical protein